ncbi:MAG: hypothetical protein ACI8QC_001784 [Planctomycetota bacterium]|jgi:hypothetical protein
MTPQAPLRRGRAWLGLVLLVLLPLGLRLGAANHGFPANHVPDTHMVRNALGMAKDKHPVPQVGQYSTYPNLLPYALLPVFGAQYALGRARGAWSNSEEFAQVVAREPWRVHLPARWLVALLGSLAAWFTYRGLRTAGLESGAWFGAYLVGTCLLHLHLSTHERPWAPLASFTALAAWPAAAYVRDGHARQLLLSGLAAALAYSSHQAGLIALGMTGLAWFWGPIGWSGAELKRRLGLGFGTVAAFFALALIVGHPYLLLHGSTAGESVIGADFLADHWHVTIGGMPIILEPNLATLGKLLPAILGYDPVLVLLGLAGLVPALRARQTRPAAAFAALAGAFFLLGQSDHVRYLLPATVLLAWPAALAAQSIWERPAGKPILLVVLALPLVQATRLVWVLRQDDTRVAIREELERFLPGARLAVDVSGPDLPLNRASLERLSEFRELGTRERMRLMLYEADMDPGGDTLGQAWDAIYLSDLFEFEYRYGASWPRPEVLERHGANPREVLADLGVTHLLLVDKTPDDGQPPLLILDEPADQTPDLDQAQHAGGVRPKMPAVPVPPRALLTQLPTATGGSSLRAQLPTEMDFALFDIWRVNRPGPSLRLYRFVP